MNIGIDISSLSYGRGVSRYTSNLIRALTPLQKTRLHLYGSSLRLRSELKHQVNTLLPNLPSEQLRIQPYPPTVLTWMWRAQQNTIRSLFPNLDVFHSWDWLQPPDSDLPLVSTIHDLAILKFPETAHPKVLSMHKASWKHIRKHQAQVIAVSATTKKDITELLEIPPARVHVIPEALPIEARWAAESLTEEQSQQTAERLNILNKPFLLFVGTREPRKNLLRLIQAWQPLAPDIDLVIAGEEGWGTSTPPSGPLPRFLGRVSDAELAVLYAEASMFVYPSLYEGFGLPILEAFMHGTPVVTSNLSGMPEVAGNAAELVHPESVESIRAGITTVLNESSAEQQKRLQRMIIRLHMFSWQRTAEETRKVYATAIERFHS